MDDKRGYVKLFRKIEDWEWSNDLRTLGFFLYLLQKANFKDKPYRGRVIPRGSLIVGRKSLAKRFKLGEQSVRTLIARLKSTNEITTKPTNEFTIISIVNYDLYQSESTNRLTNELTNDQPTGNQRVTTSKEVKNVENDKNKDISHDLKAKETKSLASKTVRITKETTESYLPKEEDIAPPTQDFVDFYKKGLAAKRGIVGVT
jgi:hypothetical protein